MDDGTDCPFCPAETSKWARDDILYEDRDTLAFFPLRPATLGHTLVIPRSHTPDFLQMDLPLARPLGATVWRVGRALKGVFAPEGMNVITSAGSAATQTVFHLHVHVVPRWTGDAMGDLWPRAESSVSPVKRELRHALRRALEAPHS